MDGALPWVSRRGTPGHNVPRPATSPADIAGLVRDTDLVSFTTRHTSPELTTNHNNLFPGRLGVALQDPSGRTDRIIRFGANPHSLALSTGEHAVKCPEGGSSSPYSSVSPELHSNPRSSTSNASSPRSTCAAPLAGLRPVPGSAATAPVPEIPEPPGPAFANYMTDDIIGHGSAPVRKGPERSGPAFNDHMTEDRGCAPVPGSASRSACTFYHAAAPLLSSSSSSLSSRRGHISTFTYSEGTSSPNHLRRHHQASSSSPASCGYISTSLSSPRDLTSASTTTTMSATPSHSRSPSAVTMPTAGSDDSGLQASTSTSTSTAAPDPSRTNKGKGKEVYTTPPGPSKKTAATAPLPATMASGSSDETVIHRGKKGPASTSSSSGEFCEMFLPSGLFTPSPQKVTKGPALAGAFSAPIFAPFAGPVFPAAADSGGLAGASVDERYAPMHTGEQGRIDASMRPIEHEAASWTASEAFKILAETVPAQYQGNPGFGWVISEVVRLAEERAKAKYGLPDHQTAAIKQYNVPFAGNLPPFQGYLLWRGDGQYTRLVPADLLPPLKGIPATQTNKVGYWVCPPPNAATETGWVYQQSIELEQLRPTSHQGVNDEELQSRIDTIIATTATTTSPIAGAVPRPAPKRVKVYCDKWIHDGTCAFTQQGCKYKHEMPHDRATQHALGLFHGYPAWWKRQQAELARQKVPASTTGTMTGTTTSTTPAGSPGASVGEVSPSTPRRAVAVGSWRSGSIPERTAQSAQHASPFGPIGPPTVNPRSRLEAVKEGEEDEEA